MDPTFDAHAYDSAEYNNSRYIPTLDSEAGYAFQSADNTYPDVQDYYEGEPERRKKASWVKIALAGTAIASAALAYRYRAPIAKHIKKHFAPKDSVTFKRADGAYVKMKGQQAREFQQKMFNFKPTRTRMPRPTGTA